MILVSVLIPTLNEEDNVRNTYKRVMDVFDQLPDYEPELIFTDNHSSDRTFGILTEIAAKDPRVRVIRFSRNVGYQSSVLTAYRAAEGACAIQLDCDLQDPPELIPQMLDTWRKGYHVVYGIRRSLPDGPVVAWLRRAFYTLIDAISQDDLPRNAGEFRLTDRRILDELRRVEDRSPYVRGLISGMGFNQIGFEYDRNARVSGESKFPLRAMIALAVDGLINHSLLPLRLASLISLVGGLCAFLLLSGYIIGKLVFGQDWPAGFATTTTLILLSMTLNAMFLGILGEYIGRIFLQSKNLNRPLVEIELNGSRQDNDTVPDRRRTLVEAAE
ncbi:glycosyl transferase, group 2 family protein [Stappia aggregata IAM 12614]|uniref:Glycosyl transferase, group 2 family protein n=1 Tax=Roseibium aggregatum (strain ATCC 25650 / DSM 13394 / JCM 20685 / NBRC 16684 / NCIMB 2208 / IAM 12614 / B1) TaxID=384765 RepID=A0NNU6_ROSAI|nr:glycosyltransferase family 2 protein [Roseibium aggregatum]EAV45827.1 glycosyl transferase, group 2 family protein [Stappia aggregata IAM 12614] [Roseibium aggregatum IAM 12614]